MHVRARVLNVAGADVGEGCRWSADRETAWRLQNGQPVEEISLAEAAKIAEAVGLPVPPPPLSTLGVSVTSTL